MAKYYISTGTLQIIFSTDKEPYDACRTAIHECNSNDEVDEYMYCDERGYRDYTTADPSTFVVNTEEILRKEGYIRQRAGRVACKSLIAKDLGETGAARQAYER